MDLTNSGTGDNMTGVFMCFRWLLYDDVDPASELAWMAIQLQASEDAGEKVYLISHHPPGHDDCTRTWSHEYNKIILRYSVSFPVIFRPSSFL